jgi:hypothetical protein
LLADDARTPTSDGLRAARTGVVLFELDAFDASL